MDKTLNLNNYSLIKNRQSINKYNLALAYVFFLIHPLLGILLMFAIIATNRSIDKYTYYSLYIFISFYFGVINTTRIPESDLLMYKNIFEDAGRYDILYYLSGYTKEIVYYLFSYVSYYILLGNFKLYLISITMIQYGLYFLSLHKMFKNNYKTVIVFAIVIHFFNVEIFFSSVHLLRQMTAASIFMYFYVTKNVEEKIHWWLIPVTMLVHSSSMLLFAISFIPTIGNRSRLKTFLIISMVGLFAILFGSQVISFLNRLTSGIPILNYPFQRFDNLAQNELMWYDGSKVFLIRRKLIIFYLFPSLFVYFTNKVENRFHSIINLVIIYIVVLELFVSSGFSYMQLRMAYYLFPYLSIVWALFLLTMLRKYKKVVSQILTFLMILYMVRRLIINFINTDFIIDSLAEIVINPLFYYIINIFT